MPSQTVLDFHSNVCGGILFHFVFKAHKLKQLLPIKTDSYCPRELKSCNELIGRGVIVLIGKGQVLSSGAMLCFMNCGNK
jgi:hypothetical protein